MRISDWSSDVCSSDLRRDLLGNALHTIGRARNPPEEFGDARVDAFRQYLDLFAQRLAALEKLAVVGLQPPLEPRKIAGEAAVGGHRLHFARYPLDFRSQETSVGKACVYTCRSRWSPSHYKKK